MRRDCNACKGRGYQTKATGEEACEDCGGMGLLEKEVPYKFDGPRSKEEIAEAFGIPLEQYVDAGHSRGDDRALPGAEA